MKGALSFPTWPALQGATVTPHSFAGVSERRVLPPPPCVLVVDDQPFVRDVLARAQRGMGLEALPAASGEEALELCGLDAGRVGLVLLDLRMPGKGGLAALAELRQERPELPVLLVCWGPGELSEQEAIRQGARALLRKPLRLGELERAVRGCLPAGIR